MHNTYQTLKHFVFALAFAAGASCIAVAQTAASQDQATPGQISSSMNPSNSMVTQAQRELKQQGFYRGKIDGIDGPQTEMAVRRYQHAQKLNESGRLDQATISSLGLNSNNSESANMQSSSRGEASRSADQSTASENTNEASVPSADTVRAAQQKLAKDGFYSGKPDGAMNQGTRAAIRQYQKANNLPVTGRLTRETAQSMGISTSNGNFENSESPLEQLGKGIAVGAKTPQHTDNSKHQKHQ